VEFDVAIIGAGPGGYVAAIRCAQLGMKTVIIEKDKTLGGTCLNVGCIPSKALLDSSEHFHTAKERFSEHGVGISDLKVDMPQMIKRKNEVVEVTVKGIDFLMKKNKIEVVHGHASFKDANTLSISHEGKNTEISAKNIIIATGSEPICPPAFNYDGNRVITSTEALDIQSVPKKMVIIGAGVIGLELGSVYARLGTEVKVVEFLDVILGGMDADVSKEMKRILKKLGMTFHLAHKVTAVKATKTKVKVEVEKKDGGDGFSLDADYCLIAIGRKAFTKNLGLEKVGIKADEKGRIEIDDHFATSVSNIYAIGDVVKGAMLAHKAEEEGIFVAEYLAGQKPHINHHLIPGVVYTWPEVASVGATEEQLKSNGTPFKVGKFPMKALGRSRASMDIEGLVKVLAHKETDEILGVHIVGARAADLIMEAVALMEFRGSAEDMARISHPHPTYSEAMKEAALAATEDRPLHI
jgi:dihydrolipoamide dehydrogenase